MKSNSILPRKRTNKAIVACIACMTALAPTLSLAASATVNFGFSGGASTTQAAAIASPAGALASPDKLGSTVATTPPSVQKTTELDTTRTPDSSVGVAQPVETTPSATPQQAPAAAKSSPKLGIGVDALWSPDLKIYTVPVSYTINRNFSIQLNLPVVTAKFNGETNTGIGDVALSLKHRIGSENTSVALFSILTAKFASGDADKGLGTGSYDVALTEKIIKKFGGFRCTLMAGFTQVLNDPTILGNKVEYGTTIAYMAAVEHTIGHPDLWLGVRAEGQHGFENKINGIALGDAHTTLDVAPELRFYYKRYTSINLGVNVPVYTEYARTGSSNTREVSASFGVSTMF
jgi:hypothetical protein